MNETKKTIVTLAIIVAIIMLLPLSLYVKNVNGKKKIDAVKEIYTTADNSLIYISSSNCPFCDEFDPIIDTVSEKHNFKYAYVDVLSLTNNQLYELLELLEISQNDFATPYLVVGEKGKKTSETSGYLPETGLIDFLKNGGFLKTDENSENQNEEDENNENLTFIDVDEYIELYEKNDKSIIVLGQTMCGACIAAKPVLNKIAKEQNITINYLETDLIDHEDKERFLDNLSKLEFEKLSTPHIMILENKEEIDSITGYRIGSEDDYLELFTKHEFVE